MNKKTTGPVPYISPMPAVLVGADVNGKPNYLTAAFAAVISHKPPLIVIGLQAARVRYTRVGLEENQVFSVNIPSRDQMTAVDYCGIFSGRNKDKSQVFTTFYGKLAKAPMIEECPVNLECKLFKEVELGSHAAFFGEVVESYADPNCLENGRPAIKKVDPLIYDFGQRDYWGLGDLLGPAHSVGKNLLEK